MPVMLETEADTRANRIDPVLRAAGWGVVNGAQIQEFMQQLFGDLDALLKGEHNCSPPGATRTGVVNHAKWMPDSVADIRSAFVGIQAHLFR